MDWDLSRRINSQANFVSPNIDNGNDDIVANDNAFVTAPGKYQHGSILLCGLRFVNLQQEFFESENNKPSCLMPFFSSHPWIPKPSGL